MVYPNPQGKQSLTFNLFKTLFCSMLERNVNVFSPSIKRWGHLVRPIGSKYVSIIIYIQIILLNYIVIKQDMSFHFLISNLLLLVFSVCVAALKSPP